MNIFYSLLVKACVPVAFVLLILWSHDTAGRGNIDIDFLLAYVLSYAFWWIFIGHTRIRHGSLLKNIDFFLFIANFRIIYKQLSNEHQRHFSLDNAVPFMDLVSIYNCIKNEILCVFSFLYMYAKHLHLTFFKGIALLVYYGFHAVAVVIILEFIYTKSMASFHLFFTDNFFYTLTANLEKDFPAGYIVPLELEKNPNYTAFIEKTYIQNTTGKFTLTSTVKEAYKDSSGEYLPYENITVARYYGEDVEFTCSCSYRNSTMFQTIWLKEEKHLEKNKRYTSTLNVSRLNDTEDGILYSVESKLRIQLLRDHDFGKYECAILTSVARIDRFLQRRKHIKKFHVLAVYQLRMMYTETKVMYRTVGSFIFSANYFIYHTFQNDDVSVEYTINNRPLGEACGGYDDQNCFIASRFHWMLDHKNIDNIADREPPFSYVMNHRDLDMYTAVISYCMCSKGFGIHRLSFRRGVYLKSQTYRILEFHHPLAIILLPYSKVSLFRYSDDHHLYKNIENLVLNGTDLAVIEVKINELLDFITANEEKVLILAHLIQVFFTTIIFIMMTVLVTAFLNLYFEWFIRVPVRQFVFHHALLQHQPPEALPHVTFDVVISNSETENGFVSDVLVHYLEHDCKLKVCVPDRDFQQGKSIFKLYAEAFSQSRKIIVVLSQEYMNNVQCSSLQLEHLIMPMLYEERKGKHDVLFVMFDNRSRLPEPLRWNFDVDVLSWTSERRTELKLKCIKSWYFTGRL